MAYDDLYAYSAVVIRNFLIKDFQYNCTVLGKIKDILDFQDKLIKSDLEEFINTSKESVQKLVFF